ncbi:MAG TPA: GNAT family N-acetyltransferase [Caulobacteraceae bacterium]
MTTQLAEVVIRPGRAPDLPALAAIEDSGAETFTRYGRPLADGSPPAPPDQWAAALDAGLLWIAEHPDDGPIGFLAGELADGGLYVEEVDVLIAHQQRGHGRRLMQAAIDWARGRGLPAVTLTTFRGIPWNAPFYASMGFEILDAAQMPPMLAATLANEAALGFEDRCGMRLAL